MLWFCFLIFRVEPLLPSLIYEQNGGVSPNLPLLEAVPVDLFDQYLSTLTSHASKAEAMSSCSEVQNLKSALQNVVSQ